MSRPQQVRGVGLIEVLVALVIIAVGLLGLLSLESRANLAEGESYQRAQALLLTMDMVNRIKANSANANCYVLANTTYSYLGTGTGTVVNTGCSATSNTDMTDWSNLLQGASETTAGNKVGAMIGARGCIYSNAANQYTVEVAWQGLAPTAAPTASDTCAQNLYPTAAAPDDKVRRTYAYTFNIAKLN